MKEMVPRRAIPASFRMSSLALLLFFTSCGTPTYDALPSEEDLPHLAALSQAWKEMPRSTHIIGTENAHGERIDVAVHTVGTGDRDRTILFLHGALSDHEAWRFVAPGLARDFDLVFVDLPGAGRSEAPDPKELFPGAYGVQDLALRVGQAVSSVLEGRPESPVLWVAHSLGGAVTLRLFNASGREAFPGIAARVDRLALLAPLDVAVSGPDPVVLEIIEIGGLEVEVADFLGLLEEETGRLTLESGAAGLVPREEATRVVRLFRDPARRMAAQAMLARAVPWSASGGPDWERIEPIVASYATVPMPTLILWGERDETLPVASGYKLRAQMPAARLLTVAGAKHSLQIERPHLVERAIREFLDRGLAGAPIGRIEPVEIIGDANGDPVLELRDTPADT